MTQSTETTMCFGCGALVPGISGPTHAYMLSAPGCWQLFGEVLAAEFSDPAFWPAHQLSVDTYAVQHPGNPDRRNRQSVALHLIGLCLQLEHHLPARQAPALRAAYLQRHRKSEFPQLQPSPLRYEVTVADVAGAPTADEHIQRVRRWADSVWQAWAAHHDQIRAYAASHPR